MRNEHFKIIFIFVFVLGMLSCSSPFVQENNLKTKDFSTPQGVMRGYLESSLYTLKGIPYAIPPIGDLRWRAPQPAHAWSGVRDQKEFGAICTQNINHDATKPIDPKSSEDCLTLNIWIPENPPSSKLPVMVFIHGGYFNWGAGSLSYYDGSYLAEHGPAITVTLNYRLGVFGFMAHPNLASENTHDSSGNYGILDQIEALKWVKTNINSFGGDPNNVTVFGQSAGAISTAILIASPLTKDDSGKSLFMRAGIMSGDSIQTTRQWSEGNGKKLAALTGCDRDRAHEIECWAATPQPFRNLHKMITATAGGEFLGI